MKKLAKKFHNEGKLPIVYVNDVLYKHNKPFYIREELLNNIYKLHESCLIRTVSYLTHGEYIKFQKEDKIFEYKMARKEFILAHKADGSMKTNSEIFSELQNIPRYPTIEILASVLLK